MWTDDTSTRPFVTIADLGPSRKVSSREGVSAAAEEMGYAKRVPAGALLLSFKLSIGRVGIPSTDVFTNEAIAWVIPRNGVLRDYLAAALEAVQWDGLGGRAVKGQTLNAKALDAVPIPLPSLDVQRRIVDFLASVDDAIDAADDEARAHLRHYEHQLARLFVDDRHDVKLGAALSRSSDLVRVESASKYPIVGVLRSGDGFIDRGHVVGSDISYTTLTRLAANELVYRKLTAWEGPISVTSESEAGGFVSGEFPVFIVDETRLSAELLRHYSRWPGLWERMRQRLTGSVLRRMRLSPEQLESIVVPMPPIDHQHRTVELLDAARDAHRSAADTAHAIRTLRSNLLTVLLSGEHEMPTSYDKLLKEVAG